MAGRALASARLIKRVHIDLIGAQGIVTVPPAIHSLCADVAWRATGQAKHLPAGAVFFHISSVQGV